MASKRRIVGFTLAEVLVVMVIVAILSALLLPVLSRSKLAAYRVVNISNLRQLCQAAAIYSVNHFNFVPSVHHKLIDAGIYTEELAGSKGDPFTEGLANNIRQSWKNINATPELDPVSFKDSIYCYRYRHPTPPDAEFAERSDTGWAVMFSRTEGSSTGRSVNEVLFPIGRYSRLRFDGSITSRTSTKPVFYGKTYMPFSAFFDDKWKRPVGP